MAAKDKPKDAVVEEPLYEPDDPARYGYAGKATSNDKLLALMGSYGVFCHPDDTEAMLKAGIPQEAIDEAREVDEE